MIRDVKVKLRREFSKGNSGEIPQANRIKELRNSHYFVEDKDLDGDAPKQFIRLYYYEKGNGVRKKNLRTWIPYIAKTAEKWYPNESVVEFLLNRIGEVLGLKMNQTKLLNINGQIRFLSRYFLAKNEVMIHGAEICGEYLEDPIFAKEIADDRQESRVFFNFQFVSKAIFYVFEEDHERLLLEFVRMLIFDALVGNNDRHFYNWAIIRSVRKRGEPRFAPIYDTARGLFWNWDDEQVIRSLKDYHVRGRKVQNYLEKAFPRVSLEDNPELTISN